MKTNLYDERQTDLFWMLFTTDIVRVANAPEDPHNICLSEPLAQTMKFPTLVYMLKHPYTNLEVSYPVNIV